MADERSSRPLRVMLADDHPVIRAGLEAMLGSAADIDVIATADTPDAAIEYVRASLVGDEEPVDVVLMDLRFSQQVGAGRPVGCTPPARSARYLGRHRCWW